MYKKLKLLFYKIFKSKDMMVTVCPFCKGVWFDLCSHKYNFDEEYKESCDEKFEDILRCKRCGAHAKVKELWNKNV